MPVQATRIHLTPSAPKAVLPLSTSVSPLLTLPAAGAAQGAEPCVSVIAPKLPGGTTPRWNQTHVVKDHRSTVSTSVEL